MWVDKELPGGVEGLTYKEVTVPGLTSLTGHKCAWLVPVRFPPPPKRCRFCDRGPHPSRDDALHAVVGLMSVTGLSRGKVARVGNIHVARSCTWS